MKARPKKPYKNKVTAKKCEQIDLSETLKNTYPYNSIDVSALFQNYESIKKELNKIKLDISDLVDRVWEIENPPLFEVGQQVSIGVIEDINIDRMNSGNNIRVYSVRLPRTDGLGEECVTHFKEDMLKRILQ